MNNNEQKIENFEQCLKEQLQAIEQLSTPKHETLFKKKLYISFLESLAKATFSEEKGVKKRFINFIDKYTTWKEWNYYCPVYLENEEKIQKILNSAWYVDIKEVAISNENDDDYKSTYAYLLYEARNSMVHQLQSPTEREESTQRHKIESPFYQIFQEMVFDESSQNSKASKEKIELVFPNTFLKKISEIGLKNFIKYCKKQQINPFKAHYSDSILFEQKI